ncbi:lactonase family protein [Flavobacterium sp. NG2]|uniref:lactonase family protein n=1 Tax=Flavobacterium sp. NG2 TaxID=3097547 RepID=UPI002A83C840|nr:lactonase family protein [Flavobacterium sp. NG2]WPR72912.1 lactonase family protein [Flavobacterium sp. NG2]
MNAIFYIGSYTEMLAPDFGGHGDGIYSVSLNTDIGEVNVLHRFQARNPSYLAISDDKKYLYSVTEVIYEKGPKIQAFEIQEDYSLQFVNELPIEGSLPCHITYANNCLLVSCYGSGNVLSFPTGDSGVLLENVSNNYHSGSSVNPLRQEGPHAHQAVFSAKESKVYVPDLGIDTVKVYKFNDGILSELISEEIFLTKGFGPRHMVFNKQGNLGYLVNELTAEVSVLKSVDQKFVQIKSYTSLPDDFNATPSASAIRMHPNGEFLYVGNRTLDAITVFKIEGEALKLVGYKKMSGKTVREFNISPDGKWLVACLQDSDIVTVYEIYSNGALFEKQTIDTVKSPVCVCFV